MLTPEQINTLKAGLPGATTSGIPSQTAPATSDWVDSLSKPKITPMVSSMIPGEGIVKNYVQGLGQTYKDIAPKLGEDITAGAQDIQQGNVAKGVLKSGGRVAGDIAGTVYAPGGAALQATGINKLFNIIGEGIANSKIVNTITDIPAVQEFAMKHPNAEEDFGRILNLVAAKLDKGKIEPARMVSEAKTAAQTGLETAKQGVQAIKEATGNVAEKVSEIPGNIKETVKPSTPEFLQKNMDLQSLQDKITPKPTIKEAKLATQQGRLIKGQEPGLFTKGTPDEVLPTKQQAKSVETINRLIPDHVKMTEPELYTSIKNKIGEVSEKLKPEMEKTPIKQQTTGKMFDSWKELKNTQSKTAEFLDNKAGNTAFQKTFENHLNELKWDITDKSGKFKAPISKTLNDIWETAKSYDNSVPDSVKKANENSSDVLQNRKEMWLQNRAILRDAINDAESGLGETSRKAFSDMRDMYEAQNGILSKAKIETKGAPSKATQFMKEHPIVPTAIEGIGAGAGLKFLK